MNKASGWLYGEFGEFVTIKSRKFDPKITNENKKCIELEHIEPETGRVLGNTTTLISKSTKNVITEGDILFGKLRPYLKKFTKAPFSGVCSSEIWVLTPNSKLTKNFLFYIIQSDDFIEQANKSCGTKMPRADWGVVQKYKIYIPPITVQEKISDILHLVDNKIDLIDEIIIQTKKLRTGLIQKLFSEGIGTLDKNNNWQPHTEFKSSVCGEIPNPWYIAKLGEHVIKVGSGVTPKGGSKAYVNHGIPLLRSQNILCGKLKLDDVAFITETQHAKMKGSQLQPRDVLLNITGASIGRCAVLPDDFSEGNVNQHVCIIRTTPSLLPEFGCIFLNSHFGQKQIWNLQAGGNREGLNFQQIRSFDIPLPPVNEQKGIVEICSTVDSKIRLLEQQKSETQNLKKGLMQKLLKGEWRIPLDCDKEEAA